MKKLLSLSIVFLLLVSICRFTNAYSNKDYSIDIPTTWQNSATNVFAKSNGDNVNVQITQYNGNGGNPYTEQQLNALVNEIYNNVDSHKDEMKAELRKTYGTRLTQSQINEYVDSFKCNNIEVKEITTCTKNNYKCFHLLANYSMADYSYYAEQYSIVSGNKIFTLTATSADKERLSAEEMKGVVDSFTIANYQAPSESSLSPALIGVIAGACAGAVVGIVNAIKNKNKNKENSEEPITSNDEQEKVEESKENEDNN